MIPYFLKKFLAGDINSLNLLVISHFGFEGGTLVLIASVPGHCLSFTLNKETGYIYNSGVLFTSI